MLRHTGRAVAEVGRTLHLIAHVSLSIAILLVVIAAGGAWRLSRGPVDLGFLKDRVETSINKSIDPIRVTIGGASVAWGGFSHGLDQPLVLRLTDVAIDTAAGGSRIRIPVAEAAVSVRWLLIGRVLPRTITLEGPRLVLARNADGTVSFGVSGASETDESSPLTGLLAILGAPAETDMQVGGGRFSQLSAVSIRGATLRLEDRVLGTTLSADRADIDLRRHRGGGMDGRINIVLTLGGEHTILNGDFNMAAAASSVHVAARLSRLSPKSLAGIAQSLAPLGALDLPLTIDGEADLRPDFMPSHFRLTARAGGGKIDMDGGSLPIHGGAITLAGTPEQVAIEQAAIELQAAPNAQVSTVGLSGAMTHQAGRLDGTLHITLDHVDFADLAALWPANISPPARAWLTQNIQAGTAHDGIADVELDSPDTGLDVALLRATATLEGDNVAVAWLSPVPRVEQAKAHLVLTDPDKIEIDVKSARQNVNGADPIPIPSGHITITGLSKKDQLATIQCEATGSVVSALALLKEPRLHLLDKHPMDLRAPAGDQHMTIRAVVPLLDNLGFDDVTIRAQGNLTKVHLTGIAAGRDLDDGAFGLDVDTNHLALKGTGRVGGIQANIDGQMDFRSGPPSQVLERITATGRATGPALLATGLDTFGALTGGEIGLSVALSEYRNGDGEVAIDADLTQAGLAVAPLAWRKPVGEAAKGSARINLVKDKLTGIDRLMLDGHGLQLRGAVTVFDGKPDTVRLDRLLLGRTDVKGTVRLPRDGPIGVDVSGIALDASAKLLEKPTKPDPAPAQNASGPAWSIRGRFDRVFLAHDQTATQVVVTAEDDGQVLRGLALAGKSGSGKPFSMRIVLGRTPKGTTARRLTVNVADAGELLHGLNATDSILGGVLTITGDFDDTTPAHVLSGSLELTDFRATQAPALGKLLQAVTLYGLVDALGGPGLGFTSLTAPFQFDGDVLVLHDARAFSPSLGLTAQGRVDWTGDRLDLEGTLVPAYVFNSLLGKIPLIGGLFSVEKGGGLFAMNYSIHGPTDNPTVVANPLSALTPGILRGMFGLFSGQPAAPPSAPAAPAPLVSPAPLDAPGHGGNARQP